jgi:hypothetical protein
MKPATLTRRLGAAALVVASAGCSQMDRNNGATTLVPSRQLDLSPSLHIPAEWMLALGAIYYIVDPLAPNWSVKVETLGERRYRMNLKMKRFITGGEGEAYQVMQRAAEKLAHDGGFPGYAVVAYQEGIESNVLVAQRVANGVVELR